MILSVIVPAYNCEHTLLKCVSSILKSIETNAEVLIINDGSTDDTLTVAQNIARIDSRVRVISQSNQGASATRNTGILQAQGDYISFVDADDWIDSPYTLYKSLTESITNSDAVLAIAGYSTSQSTNNLILDNRTYRRGNAHDFEDLILLTSIGKIYSKLIKRSFLLTNNILLPIGMKHQEDAVFLYKMLTFATVVTTTTDASYLYVLPEKQKKYTSSLQDELKGYGEMCHAVDTLIQSFTLPSQRIKARLEKRKINLALHVYSSIQTEPLRTNRINAYNRVAWKNVLPHLGINPIKKLLMRLRLFRIVDLISRRPKSQKDK